MKTEGAKLSKENKALQLKVKNQEIKLQDKSDSVDILKHSVHKKCLEIVRLRQEVDDMRISHDIVKNKDNLTEEKSDTFPDDEQASTSAKKHLKCDECNDEFDQKEHLETHVREHHEWTCEYCEFRTIKEYEPVEHVNVCHMNKCEECDFKTKSKVEYEKHLSNEHTLKCFKCEEYLKQEVRN